MATKMHSRVLKGIEKIRTGITGIDQITFGGLSKGRSTIICGSAGSNKTLMSFEMLMRGALDFND